MAGKPYTFVTNFKTNEMDGKKGGEYKVEKREVQITLPAADEVGDKGSSGKFKYK